jgi:hemolysin activation/secretion protein
MRLFVCCCAFIGLYPVLTAMAQDAPAARAQSAQAASGAAEAAVPGERFDVLEFEIEGNTILPTATIEKAVYRFLGPGGGIKEVEAARDALERAYQDAGFLTVLVDIPEQRIEGGIVLLKVIEAPVERLRVSGNTYYARGELRSRVPALAEGGAPYFPDVQKQLAELNRTGDRRVTPVLRPGKTPGTVEAELKVEDQLPFHGSLEYNNRYSYDTTRTRLLGNLRYDNLWQRDHSISLSYQTTPENTNEVSVWSATYVIPLGGGNMLALYAVKSDSNVASVGATNIIGRGDIHGLRYIAPLPAFNAYTHSYTLGVDRKQFNEKLLFGADSTVTPISYAPFLGQYGGNLATESSTTQFNIAANFSIRRFADKEVQCGTSLVNAFACKRFGASADYMYFRGDISHTRSLPWKFALNLRLAGQLATQPLISNEQFGAGGADSVRGYREFERTGDSGIFGSVELRSPSLTAAESAIPQLNIAAFADAADLRYLNPLPGQESRFSLSSAGVGFRVRVGRGASANIDMAWPFMNNARNTPKDPSVHFKLAYDF